MTLIPRFIGGAILCIVLALGLLTGCGYSSTPVPRSPDQVLFGATSAYAAALTVVVNYGKSPPCPGNTFAAGCHNGPFLVLAQKTSNGIADSLAAARPVVDAYNVIASPTASDTAKVMAAVTGVSQAVAGLKTIAAQIGG